jgi:hypothetical protein
MLPKIDRRGWLALWAQGRRRARQHHLLPAPVLWAEYPGILYWDWDLPNPYRWNVWLSWDGGTSWVLVEDYWTNGADRDFFPDGGSPKYFIVGVDANGVEITGRSNIVRPDDAPVPPSLLSDLVGFWKMDEMAGENRLDVTGNGYDLVEWSFAEADGGGSSSDSLIPSTVGKIGDAAAFVFGPGQGLVTSLPNGLAGGDFSFSCWVNYNADEGFDGQGMISLGGLVAIGIRAYTGATDFAIYNAITNQHSYIQSPEEAFTPWEWAHAVYVKDGGTLRIYVNGVEVVNGPYSGSQAGLAVNHFTDEQLIVGINPWGYPLVGFIDEVGCWSRALSAYDVEQLYNYGSGLTYENF